MALEYIAGLAGCFALGIIFRLYRQTKLLKALLTREKQQSFLHYNKIVKTLSESFSKQPPPTLEELARNIDEDYKLK